MEKMAQQCVKLIELVWVTNPDFKSGLFIVPNITLYILVTVVFHWRLICH